MENKNDYKEERFDSYLNKIIIFSSKNYFKKQMNIIENERTVVNNEAYSAFIQNFATLDEDLSIIDNINDTLELNKSMKSLSVIEQSVIFLLFN